MDGHQKMAGRDGADLAALGAGFEVAGSAFSSSFTIETSSISTSFCSSSLCPWEGVELGVVCLDIDSDRSPSS